MANGITKTYYYYRLLPAGNCMLNVNNINAQLMRKSSEEVP